MIDGDEFDDALLGLPGFRVAAVGEDGDEVAEIVSLGHTLRHWRREILAHHATGASNGPTEAMNIFVKKIKRRGHGFKSFSNYRLRVLLHCGGIKWDAQAATTMPGTHPVGRVEPAMRVRNGDMASEARRS